MHAKAGDWLIVEMASVDHEARRGRIVEVLSATGRPPYRVRWLDTGREALVFPGPDAHVMTQHDLDTAAVRATARAARVQQEISHRS